MNEKKLLYTPKEEGGNDECSSIVTSTRIHNPHSLFFSFVCVDLFSFFRVQQYFSSSLLFKKKRKKECKLLNAIARWRHRQLSTLRRRPNPHPHPPRQSTNSLVSQTSVVLTGPVQSRLCRHLGRIRTHPTHHVNRRECTHTQREL